jgi:hypothetical protein
MIKKYTGDINTYMRDVLLNERSLESTHDEDSSKWIDTQPNKVVPVSSRRS